MCTAHIHLRAVLNLEVLFQPDAHTLYTAGNRGCSRVRSRTAQNGGARKCRRSRPRRTPAAAPSRYSRSSTTSRSGQATPRSPRCAAISTLFDPYLFLPSIGGGRGRHRGVPRCDTLQPAGRWPPVTTPRGSHDSPIHGSSLIGCCVAHAIVRQCPKKQTKKTSHPALPGTAQPPLRPTPTTPAQPHS